ncbi:unnamed protein product [Cuscuta epithymum]|uniref:NAC domain-containing protein n=1 Tax=Cuscuta epithymum TaxID=186058 RepID=A0AAV0GCA5_9ASTE|nr:unnamed protein product [Cuscuta epithymum]
MEKRLGGGDTAAEEEQAQQQMDLPPGFRFHPTDEELITHYLTKKALDCSFSAIAIGEVDMNKVEPWDLPWKSRIGEKEWYFFCVRDKKYPTGLRTNRATASGYWKATGKDKDIFRGKCLVGMKKTLVFYHGRAPKGEKTNWVCHEYRLEGKFSLHNFPNAAQHSDWVISRVFHKSSGGKKDDISGLLDNNRSSVLPPLADSSPTRTQPESGSHVHCFSKNQQESMGMMNSLNNPAPLHVSSSSSSLAPDRNVFQWGFLNYGSFPPIQEDHVNLSFKTEDIVCLENGELKAQMSSGPHELDCLWSY